MNGVSGWVPYGFANGFVQDLVDTVVPSWKGDSSGALDADRLCASG